MSRIQRGRGGGTAPRAALCDCPCHPFPWPLGQWPCLLAGTSACTAAASRTPSQEHIRDSVPKGACSFLSDWSRKDLGGGGSQTEIVVDHLTENTDPEVYGGQEWTRGGRVSRCGKLDIPKKKKMSKVGRAPSQSGFSVTIPGALTSWGLLSSRTHLT